MGQSTDPQNVKRHGDELEDVLKKAHEAGERDDPGEISADDAGGTRLAEGLDDAEGETEAHPS